MNERQPAFADDRQLFEFVALAMRRNADAVLDGTHSTPGIPESWAYALLGIAGWLETEAQNPNARTRPYARSVALSFVFGAEAVDL